MPHPFYFEVLREIKFISRISDNGWIAQQCYTAYRKPKLRSLSLFNNKN